MQNASTSSYPSISSYKNIDFKALWTYLESDHCHVFSWLGCYNPLIMCRADSLTDSCNKCNLWKCAQVSVSYKDSKETHWVWFI